MKFRVVEKLNEYGKKKAPINKLITKIKEVNEDWREFKHGGCYELASALHYLYGGDLYAIEMYHREGDALKKYHIPRHVYLQYNNKFWDIMGSHTSEEIMLNYWKKLTAKDEREDFLDVHIEDFKLEKLDYPEPLYGNTAWTFKLLDKIIKDHFPM